MIRFFLIALIIYGLLNFYRLFRGRRKNPQEQIKKNGPSEMIACSRCGTFVVSSEAVKHKSQLYCSEICLKELEN